MTTAPHHHQRWEREHPLKRCPEATCRRQGRCLNLTSHGQCLITHHRDQNEWAGWMAAKIIAFNEKCRRENPDAPPEAWSHGEEAAAAWKRALEERAAELRAEHAAAAPPPPRRRAAPKGAKRRT